MTIWARSATLSEHGTQGGTQRNITSRSGRVPRTVRDEVPASDVLRKLNEAIWARYEPVLEQFIKDYGQTLRDLA